MTALIFASLKGFGPIVELLLQASANPDIKNKVTQRNYQTLAHTLILPAIEAKHVLWVLCDNAWSKFLLFCILYILFSLSQ